MSCSFWHFRYQSQTLQNAIAIWVALQCRTTLPRLYTSNSEDLWHWRYILCISYYIYMWIQWDKKHYLFFIILNLWYRARWHLTTLYTLMINNLCMNIGIYRSFFQFSLFLEMHTTTTQHPSFPWKVLPHFTEVRIHTKTAASVVPKQWSGLSRLFYCLFAVCVCTLYLRLLYAGGS